MELRVLLQKLKENNDKGVIMLKEKDDIITPVIIMLLHIITLLMGISYFIDMRCFLAFREVYLLLYVFQIFIAVMFDKKLNKTDILNLFLLCLFYYLTLQVNNGGLGSVVSLVLPLVILCCFEYSDFDVNYRSVFNFVLRVLSIFVIMSLAIITTFVVKDYSEWFYKYDEFNPNAIGMIALSCFMLWCSMTKFDEWKNKLLFILFLLVVFIIIQNVKARTSLLGLSLFCAIFVLPKKIITKNVMLVFTIVVVTIGLLIPIIYLLLYNGNFTFELFGKTLFTGREIVWAKMFDLFNNGGLVSWLFGIGSHAQIFETSFDAHNSYFSIIGCFGVLGFAAYVLFFFSKIKSLYDYMDDDIIRKLLVSFLAVLTIGFFEAVFLVSVAYFSLFAPIGFAINRTQTLRNERRMIADIHDFNF